MHVPEHPHTAEDDSRVHDLASAIGYNSNHQSTVQQGGSNYCSLKTLQPCDKAKVATLLLQVCARMLSG